MPRKTNPPTDYLVTGPGCEGREVASATVGMSLAQTYASRAEGDCTFYVRTGRGVAVAQVSRQGKTVLTRRMAS